VAKLGCIVEYLLGNKTRLLLICSVAIFSIVHLLVLVVELGTEFVEGGCGISNEDFIGFDTII